MEYRLIYTTWPDEDSARSTGKALIEQKLAACTNILPGMRSIYRWESTLEEAQEVVMLVKTTAQKTEAATEAIISAHPYDCPCVIALPIEAGNPEFLQWINSEVS